MAVNDADSYFCDGGFEGVIVRVAGLLLHLDLEKHDYVDRPLNSYENLEVKGGDRQSSLQTPA